MALAAIIAVIHDIIITVGVYAVTQFEVTPATVVAFLTILGFSLYDTVVVFDKVKDNQARLGTVRGDTYSSMVNRSLNQVLMRSINTSIVALLPVASLLFVGTYVFGGLGAARLRAGAVRRPAHRRVLVDLRGHADPRVAQGAGARYRALRERAAADLAKAQAVAPVAPVAPGARGGRARRRRGRRTARRRRSTTSTTPTTRTSRSAAPTAAPRRRRRRSRRRSHRGRGPRPRRGARPTRAVASSGAASAADPSLRRTGPGNTRPAGRVVAQMSTTDLSGSGPRVEVRTDRRSVLPWRRHHTVDVELAPLVNAYRERHRRGRHRP